MAYLGSEAYRLDVIERSQEQLDVRPSFDVIEGGGADARVRRGVSTTIAARFKMILVAVSVFVIVGSVRVAITAMTVSELTENVSLEHQIAEAESTNSDLMIGRSILSSSSRIDRIAVDNYGMVYATDRDVIVLDNKNDAAQASSSETQSEVDESASSSEPQLSEVADDGSQNPEADLAS